MRRTYAYAAASAQALQRGRWAFFSNLLGTLFDRAYTAATTTTPSHMTIFTSLPPSVHRIVGISSLKPLTLPIPTLPE